MEKLYAEKELIRYIYGECDFFERFEVEDAIEHDVYTHEAYKELCRILDELPKVHFLPSQKSIQNILAFAGKEIE